jgi:hypothetical protein
LELALVDVGGDGVGEAVEVADAAAEPDYVGWCRDRWMLASVVRRMVWRRTRPDRRPS